MKNPLELLKKFFREHSKEEVKEITAKYQSMKFEGPTVEEYFDLYEADRNAIKGDWQAVGGDLRKAIGKIKSGKD